MPEAGPREGRVRLLPDPLRGEVDIAARPEHRDEGVGPDEEVGPEGKDGEEEQNRLPAGRRERDGDRDRETDREADEGGEGREPERLPEDLKIEGVEGTDVVLERSVDRDLDEAPLLAEAEAPDEREGGEEEEDEPRGRGQEERPEGPPIRAPSLHRGGLPARISVRRSGDGADRGSVPMGERRPRTRETPGGRPLAARHAAWMRVQVSSMSRWCSSPRYLSGSEISTTDGGGKIAGFSRYSADRYCFAASFGVA